MYLSSTLVSQILWAKFIWTGSSWAASLSFFCARPPPSNRLVAGYYRRDFCCYALFAYLFPGPFYGRGWSVSRVATYLYLDRNGSSASL